MRLPGLAWRLMSRRPLVTALNVLLLALGVASFSVVALVSAQLDRALQRDLAGIDLVVGAKGSPMQLILSGVFHLDAPTGNIPWASVAQFRQHPWVEEVIPLSLGDSVQGYRVVGTEAAYLLRAAAGLALGRPWQRSLEAVLGAEVARATGLKPGQNVAGTHGLGDGGEAHGDRPYTVVGILAPCQCALDRLVMTSLESVWEVHAGHAPDTGDGEPTEHPEVAAARREVTLLLLRYRSPLAAASLPRAVQAMPGLQAASPALESARLLRMVGVGREVVQAFGLLLVLVAAATVGLVLHQAVRERGPDLAMLRMLGASRARLAALVAWECQWLVLMGAVLGLVLGHGAVAVLGHALAQQRSLILQGAWWAPEEGWALLLIWGTTLLAAAWPAWQASRRDALSLLQASP